MAVEDILAPAAGRLLHRPEGTGDMYWGPGDLYRFLVTGAETGGAYFAMEAVVPPGGGPPPHIHTNEDETFYVVEGRCSIRLGDEWVTAGADAHDPDVHPGRHRALLRGDPAAGARPHPVFA